MTLQRLPLRETHFRGYETDFVLNDHWSEMFLVCGEIKAVLFLQSVSENKRKMGEAKRRWEEEVEEMKTTHEAEMTGLREKMRKEKNVASTSTSEQLAQLERELEEQWKSRAERQVSTVEERWRRKLDEAREEQRSLQDQLRETNMKVRDSSHDMYTHHRMRLQSSDCGLFRWRPCVVRTAVRD